MFQAKPIAVAAPEPPKPQPQTIQPKSDPQPVKPKSESQPQPQKKQKKDLFVHNFNNSEDKLCPEFRTLRKSIKPVNGILLKSVYSSYGTKKTLQNILDEYDSGLYKLYAAIMYTGNHYYCVVLEKEGEGQKWRVYDDTNRQYGAAVKNTADLSKRDYVTLALFADNENRITRPRDTIYAKNSRSNCFIHSLFLLLSVMGIQRVEKYMTSDTGICNAKIQQILQILNKESSATNVAVGKQEDPTEILQAFTDDALIRNLKNTDNKTEIMEDILHISEMYMEKTRYVQYKESKCDNDDSFQEDRKEEKNGVFYDL